MESVFLSVEDKEITFRGAARYNSTLVLCYPSIMKNKEATSQAWRKPLVKPTQMPFLIFTTPLNLPYYKLLKLLTSM